MQISTTRFGKVGIEAGDVFYFPRGLIGLAQCHHWVLLADGENEALGWFQSTGYQDIAMAVISPRRFLPNYRVRVRESELAEIDLVSPQRAYVLNVVSMNDGRLTANLRAPLVFNLSKRVGRQIVTRDEQPVQWALAFPPLTIRKSA